MHILIDAYNLIKKIYPNQTTSKETIKGCIERLVKYATGKKHVLAIVFDGGIAPWPTSQDYSCSCRVWWVGYGAKADDLIKELLETKSYHLLVSCDRELVVHAQTNKVPSIEVAYFWEFVNKALGESKKNNEKPVRTVTMDSSAGQSIEALMDEFTFQSTNKDECIGQDDAFLSKKHLSKLEVRLYTIIKKL